MLQLTHDQVALLGAQARERFVRALGPALAPLWPTVTQRLGSRLDAFIDLAVEHAQRHGLAGGVAVATYVNLWFLWGPRFDEQPGFEWARDILANPRGDERAKTYPLVAATLERLQRRDAPQSSAGKSAEVLGLFVASHRAIEARFGLSSGLDATNEKPAPRRVTGVCDLQRLEAAVSLDGPLKVYERAGPGWALAPVAAAVPLVIDDAAEDGPQQLEATAPERGSGRPARLRVRIEAHSLCAAQAHPQVRLVTPDGERQWSGQTGIDVDVTALPVTPQPPPIAATSAPARYRISVSTCGVRSAGLPIGKADAGIDLYPAAQWLREYRHGPMPPMHLSGSVHAPVPDASGIDCRLECDGRARDARALQQGFVRLRADFAAAMDKLLAIWTATAGLERATLDVKAGLLEGAASFVWGWRPAGREALLAVHGQARMAGCLLDLTLEGDLTVQGTPARVMLKSQGRADLEFKVERSTPQAKIEEAFAAAQVRFRFPFTLDIDTQANAGLGAIGASAPVTGALAGACGLRPAGNGYELFIDLKAEPAATTIVLTDPLLGARQMPRPLLPAVPLLSWTLS